jgi:hypothetical protein
MSKKSKPVLFLFVRNEEVGCRASVPEIDRDLFDSIIAIDASSVDGTREYLESVGIRVAAQAHAGYSGAYMDCVDLAAGKPFVVFHPKGTIPVASLSEINDRLVAGADLVIASRMAKGGRNADDDQVLRHRKWFGLFAGMILWLRLGRQHGLPRVTDPLHGIRGFSGEFGQILNLEPGLVTADLEIVKQAYAHSMVINEVPVVEVERLSGKTNFPTFRTGRRLLGALFS